MSASMPAYRSDSNYCEDCSPFGFPYGEPGCDCSVCGRPLQLSSQQVAASRSLRNQVTVAKRGVA